MPEAEVLRICGARTSVVSDGTENSKYKIHEATLTTEWPVVHRGEPRLTRSAHWRRNSRSYLTMRRGLLGIPCNKFSLGLD